MSEKEAKGEASSSSATTALLKEIRDIQMKTYELQSRLLFVLVPIFALLTIMTILGLTGYFAE